MTWSDRRSLFLAAITLVLAGGAVTSRCLGQTPAESTPATTAAAGAAAVEEATPAVSAPASALPPSTSSRSQALATTGPAPVSDSEPRHVSRTALITSLTIFVLAIFVGFEVIAKVPPTLHTPLMSGSNAISGITLVGAVIVAGIGFRFSSFIGFLAVIVATINAVGGFVVTHRMLAMFKRK